MFAMDPVSVADDAMAAIGGAYARLLDAIPSIEASERWIDDGARSVVHWLAMRYGIGEWRAGRSVGAAYALPALPRMREALLAGERQRSVRWWYEDDGRRFGLEASLPAADGAIVAKALDRLANAVPEMPDEPGEAFRVVATSSGWASTAGSRRRGCSGRSATATASAGSRAAAPGLHRGASHPVLA